MPTPKKKDPAPARGARSRSAHNRQRQRLIDACISALHIYGPSRTTVEKVVAIAKMSPGIVRFYFASKAAMLVASLQFLASEFEEQLLVPVARLKSSPVAALELMVDLYLDPEIASPRKVSVWYAFWGEASSRQEYYDICGQKDESFAALVRELIERLIALSSQPHLDPDGIALGLIGALEMLWQDFAFQDESDIDRPAAKERCMAYLRSIFPGQFASSGAVAERAADGKRPAAWVYDNARLFALEQESVFAGSWQLAGHGSQIPQGGDFVSVDLKFERALVVCDAAGELRAFRNGDLTPLELRLAGDLILVRAADRPQTAAALADSWWEFRLPSDSRALGPPTETAIAADWKIVVEQWLEAMPSSGSDTDRPGWSAREYRHLLQSSACASPWPLRFLAPNHLAEERPDGTTILQALPVGPGRSMLRRHHFTRCALPRAARAAQYLASRVSRHGRRSAIDSAESTQSSLVRFGHVPAGGAQAAPALAAFRRHLVALVPALTLSRPPDDP
jgi:TetR/AcrR family transcriptional repressor of bet genes